MKRRGVESVRDESIRSPMRSGHMELRSHLVHVRPLHLVPTLLVMGDRCHQLHHGTRSWLRSGLNSRDVQPRRQSLVWQPFGAHRKLHPKCPSLQWLLRQLHHHNLRGPAGAGLPPPLCNQRSVVNLCLRTLWLWPRVHPPVRRKLPTNGPTGTKRPYWHWLIIWARPLSGSNYRITDMSW